jgi:hypothetical protein
MSSGQQDPRASRWVVRAWLSVALIPVFLVAVSYAALTFYRETRYDTADHYVPEWANGMPWWAVLLQGVIGIALFSIPCVAAVWCGRRATRGATPAGLRPRSSGSSPSPATCSRS